MELPQMRHYTLEEYWQFMDSGPQVRYEYVDGEIRAMPGGTRQHAVIGSNVNRALGNALDDCDCCVFSPDGGVLVTGSRVYYPDVSVSCDTEDLKSGLVIKYPCVIVEVLSPSTELLDRTEKLVLYQRMPNVKDILLISSQRYKVEHFWRDDIHWRRSLYEKLDDVVTLTSVNVQLLPSRIYKKAALEKTSQ
jgi:Uma2 family endonuclease